MKHIPTFGELFAAYPEAATLERLKNQRPSPGTVMNVLSGVRRLLETFQRDGETVPVGDLPITWLTRRRLETFLVTAAAYGLNATSAQTYLAHLRALTARWTLPHYDDRGWRVPPFPIPVCRRAGARYIRPERSVLLRVRAWYDALHLRADKRDWLTATLMLEFAMRNSDIKRLQWSDFRPKEDHMVLCYTPHKTELSSGRIVAWPVHPTLWHELCVLREQMPDYAGTRFQGFVVPSARGVFTRLNAEIRAQHFFTRTHKGLYELRKICIDHVYQRFGAEMASAISGDDIRTVTRYYADPSAVAAVGLRIVDLL